MQTFLKPTSHLTPVSLSKAFNNPANGYDNNSSTLTDSNLDIDNDIRFSRSFLVGYFGQQVCVGVRIDFATSIVSGGGASWTIKEENTGEVLLSGSGDTTRATQVLKATIPVDIAQNPILSVLFSCPKNGSAKEHIDIYEVDFIMAPRGVVTVIDG